MARVFFEETGDNLPAHYDNVVVGDNFLYCYYRENDGANSEENSRAATKTSVQCDAWPHSKIHHFERETATPSVVSDGGRPTCPTCGQPVIGADYVGPDVVRVRPCGHQHNANNPLFEDIDIENDTTASDSDSSGNGSGE